MQQLKTLIDKAIEMCGSGAALAKELQCSPALITMMRKGERSVTPEIAIVVADMLGEDVDWALRQAHIDASVMNKNGKKIREILGKGLAGGAVAMLAFSSNAAHSAPTSIIKNDSALVNDSIHRIYKTSKHQKIIQPSLDSYLSLNAAFSD